MSQLCSLLDNTLTPLTSLIPLEEFQAQLASLPTEVLQRMYGEIERQHAAEVPGVVRQHREELEAAEDQQVRVLATTRLAARVRALDVFVGDPLNGAALKIKGFASQLFEHRNFFNDDPLTCRRFEVTCEAILRPSLEWELRNMPLYVARKQAKELFDCVSRVGGSAEPAADASTSGSRRRGRKPTYDWPPFHAAVREVVKSRGVPSRDNPEGEWQCLADLERYMNEWCDDNWPGKDPSESTIRSAITKALG